jgi:deazaflavin-dependent oxidoreductase (nitroreductase family)
MVGRFRADRPGVAARYRQVMEPKTLQILRRVFHQMNRGMVLLWRLGLGRLANVWPHGFGRLLVIEHIGRRSGSRYLTPVNYTAVDDGLYCVAAFGEDTDWYRNLLAAPEAAAWLPDGRWEVVVTDASDDSRRLHLMRRVLIDSGFAARLFGLNPHRIGDEDLAEATATYRLLRIQPLRRSATSDGPGDLAWIWIPIGAAITIRLIRRRSQPA